MHSSPSAPAQPCSTPAPPALPTSGCPHAGQGHAHSTAAVNHHPPQPASAPKPVLPVPRCDVRGGSAISRPHSLPRALRSPWHGHTRGGGRGEGEGEGSPSARLGQRDSITYYNVSVSVTRNRIGGVQSASRHQSSKWLSKGSVASAPLCCGGKLRPGGVLGGREGWGGPRPPRSARHPPIIDAAARHRLVLTCPLAGGGGSAAEGTAMAHQGGHPGRRDTPVRNREPCLWGALPWSPHSNQRFP